MNVIILGLNSGFSNSILNNLPADTKIVGTGRGVNRYSHDERVIGFLSMDITNDESVEDAMNNAISMLDDKVDAVINCIGMGTRGYSEKFTTDQMKKVFDINIFGTQRLFRAILPQMKKQRFGSIITVTALLGRFCVPFLGPYTSSKWALEGLLESYRHELKKMGIGVFVVEPGAQSTNFGVNAMLPDAEEATNRHYDEYDSLEVEFFKTLSSVMKEHTEQDPAQVGKAIADVALNPLDAPFRVEVDTTVIGEEIKKLNASYEASMDKIFEGYQIKSLLK
ncbi:SDR family NAD(P)-dependent oxidoreductase [Vibrio sp. SS-MA-C1-2]|uniref:SDR family NAD(P)-dependent oxidoreductase n=1 Tax=Vibrio sp. SS-MA-C1-2 TaxID=2908646 RepID=UPI001F16491B|nr:SDR family NAD(P)-dependent oxidoreductase [Vibrio sp. SS-MA-C1-2]UJF18411.1 SDR family NAD(P)-dependent oxidoreductase [Vibrio sp. SS-MA-C1-2]